MRVENKQILDDVTARAAAALNLLDQESADGIIGERTPEYDTLIQGAQAILNLAWTVYKQHGLRETPKALRHGAQTLVAVVCR